MEHSHTVCVVDVYDECSYSRPASEGRRSNVSCGGDSTKITPVDEGYAEEGRYGDWNGNCRIVEPFGRWSCGNDARGRGSGVSMFAVILRASHAVI